MAKQKILRVAIVGPESTGKTSLAVQLADEFDSLCVPEYSRSYLEELNRPYLQADLIEIARGQLALEKLFFPQANKVLFCDTNLLVIKIWSEYKYGSLDPALEKLVDLNTYDLHLLPDIDLPWTEDPLREHPSVEDRERLFHLYKQALIEAEAPFEIIRGIGESRLEMAQKAVLRLIQED